MTLAPNARERSAADVFESHRLLAREGDVEEDIAQNYAPDVVLLTGRGALRGHAGVRRLSEALARELPDARFRYETRVVAGDVAFLEWTATARGARVEDGADSFVIRGGRIVAQTIHYTVRPSGSDRAGAGFSAPPGPMRRPPC